MSLPSLDCSLGKLRPAMLGPPRQMALPALRRQPDMKMTKMIVAAHPWGHHFATKCGNLVHCMCVFYNDLHRLCKKLCLSRLPSGLTSPKIRWSSWNEARLKNVTPWKWLQKICLWNVESVDEATLLVAEGSGRSGVQCFYGRLNCVA